MLEQLKYLLEPKGTLMFMDLLWDNYSKEIIRRKDDAIKLAFKEAGYDNVDEKFVKENNVVSILIEGDPFEHYFIYYGTPQEQRIISFERKGKFESFYVSGLSTQPQRINYSLKYY